VPSRGSIRRKLQLGAWLVLATLVAVSAGGIYGLNSYRNVVRDFDYDISQAPQPRELVRTIGLLFEPLRPTMRDDRGAPFKPRGEALSRALQKRLILVREAANELRRRTDEQPPSEVAVLQRPVTDALLAQLDDWLLEIDELRLRLERESPELYPATEQKLLERIADMQLSAQRIPEPVVGLAETLERARHVYRSTLVTVWVASIVALLLFGGLLRYGYKGIFVPIHEMHKGARRVARGDLDKKVQDRSRQLVRSERLAGVGFLAAGVAHEINNPLSAIAMGAESIEGRIEAVLAHLDPSEGLVVRQYLQMIQKESFRCREITERLLDLSRGRESHKEPVDLSRLIYDVIAVIQHLGKYRGKHVIFDRSEPCMAYVCPAEIKQVVLNLVANGLDAVEQAGSLTIRLRDEPDSAIIEFEDNGCGMTAEVLESIFEPFFTSKQVGQGTGLGLSICHRIVTEHRGAISAASAGPGQGSTFRIRLPRSEVPAGAAERFAA
jgi:two-component system, NtrC family, sensor kinase